MLGREVFWSIPYDRNISTATQLGMPVVVAKPTSKASESMVELAYTLSGVKRQEPTQQKQGGKGLFSRILGTATEEKSKEKAEEKSKEKSKEKPDEKAEVKVE